MDPAFLDHLDEKRGKILRILTLEEVGMTVIHLARTEAGITKEIEIRRSGIWRKTKSASKRYQDKCLWG